MRRRAPISELLSLGRRAALFARPSIAAVTLAVMATLAGPASARQVLIDCLDPQTYRSPSGDLAQRVVPTERHGRGEAEYRLERDGRELWSGRRPFTLFGAAVSDEGLVAGYSYAAGEAGGEGDALSIVLLDETGATRWIHRFERSGSVTCLSSTDPNVLDLWLDAARDRLVVRMGRSGEFRGEEWWSFELSTGAAGPRVRPMEFLSSDERIYTNRAAQPVPGSSLALLHWLWWDSDAKERGAVFTLQEHDGRVVWRLDWPQDYTVAGDEQAKTQRMREPARTGAILELGADRFALRSMASDERVTFGLEAASAPAVGWRVRELSREPYAPEAPASATAIPAEPLEHLGSISLDLEARKRAPGTVETTEAVWIAGIALGPHDRIHVVDNRQSVVDVFDASGAWLFACVPDGSMLGLDIKDPTVTVGASGQVFVSAWHGAVGTLARFGPDGGRLDSDRLALDEIRQQVHVQPSGARAWVVGYDALYLLGPDGGAERVLERASDGTWLRGMSVAALGPDGSIAVSASLGFGIRTSVAIYSAAGEPRATIAAPEGFHSWDPIAFDGERVAFGSASGYEGPTVVVAILDGAVSTHRLTPSVRARIPLFPRTARELWIFDGERKIERYALP